MSLNINAKAGHGSRRYPVTLNTALSRLLFNRIVLPMVLNAMILACVAFYHQVRDIRELQRQFTRTVTRAINEQLGHMEKILNAIALLTEDMTESDRNVIMAEAGNIFDSFDSIRYVEFRLLGWVPNPNGPEEGLYRYVPFLPEETGKPVLNIEWLSPQGIIVVGTLNLESIQKMIDRKYGAPGNDMFYIISKSGVYLAHSNSAQVGKKIQTVTLNIIQNAATGRNNDLSRANGTLFLFKVVLMEKTGWGLIIHTVILDKFKPYIILLMLFGVLSFIIWLVQCRSIKKRVNRLIVTPLNQLKQCAIALEKENYEEGERLITISLQIPELELLRKSICKTIRAVQSGKRLLKESEDRFIAFMEHSPVYAYIKNEKLEMIYGNRKTLGLLRRGATGVLTTYDFFEQDLARSLESVDRKIVSGESENEEIEYITVIKGEERWLRDIKFPIVMPDKKKIVGGVALDITDLKRLQQDLVEEDSRVQRNIGSELHDGVCQQLGGIAFLCESLAQEIAETNPELSGRLEKIRTYVSEALQLTRNLSRGLYPVLQGKRGLMSSLEELAESLYHLYGVSCAFRCPHHVLMDDNVVATHLFRIAQEAVNNAAKHGKASYIEIGLEQNKTVLIITVKDNGQGLKKADLSPSSRGKGIHIMRNRARIIGAYFSIRNSDEGGVSIRCEVPV